MTGIDSCTEERCWPWLFWPPSNSDGSLCWRGGGGSGGPLDDVGVVCLGGGGGGVEE